MMLIIETGVFISQARTLIIMISRIMHIIYRKIFPMHNGNIIGLPVLKIDMKKSDNYMNKFECFLGHFY